MGALSPVELAAWDAARVRDGALAGSATRLQHGVVHTPPVLARAVARAVDDRLRTLGLIGGLLDDAVDVIDPACGPGAFLAAVLGHAADAGSAACRLHGLDLDAGAVSRARQVLAGAAADVGCPLSLDVADTLRDAALLQRFGGLRWPVIVGNPPWATARKRPPAPHLSALLRDYRALPDGTPLGERKIGALSDSYVAFMRWASAVACAGLHGGVLALVTNNSFLDGPVHRGMRAHLLHTFDGLEVLDLGGNAMVAQAGPRDGNVFGVRTGAAITLAWRQVEPGAKRKTAAKYANAPARYHRLRGGPEDKLSELASTPAGKWPFETLRAADPDYRFVPTRPTPQAYARWPALCELMPFHREGVQTNRDTVAIDVDAEALLGRLHDFVAGRENAGLAPALRTLSHYDPERARTAVAEALSQAGGVIEPIAYRPFDTRYFVPVAPLCHRPRPKLRAAMAHSELAIVSVRKDRGSMPWRHVCAVESVPDSSFLSARSSCRTRAFPTHGPDGVENVDAVLRAQLEQRAGRALSALDVALYVLGVLSAPGFQRRFDEALRRDYPRVPWPRRPSEFDTGLAMGCARWAAIRQSPADASSPSEPAPAMSTKGLPELRIGHVRVCASYCAARPHVSPREAQTLLSRVEAWLACDARADGG